MKKYLNLGLFIVIGIAYEKACLCLKPLNLTLGFVLQQQRLAFSPFVLNLLPQNLRAKFYYFSNEMSLKISQFHSKNLHFPRLTAFAAAMNAERNKNL
ncbi:CLUMA_CG019701, isoform A [Clunio marinus]|uniref:CLUMA_CG019701, isoform A n=1 Tax=Clunio marinus TaxID=568069 RepID=A0A1J1J287_9DIPT|nr:CLUMA_CG019701, isoform A [Clunio marinus]